MLPSYRPAPDYETAIQQKYRGHAVLYSSQPEIHQTNLHEVILIILYYIRFPVLINFVGYKHTLAYEL